MNQEIEELYVRNTEDFSSASQQVKWYVKNLESWKNCADIVEDEEPAENIQPNKMDRRYLGNASSDCEMCFNYNHQKYDKQGEGSDSSGNSCNKSCGFKFDGAPFAPPSHRPQQNWNWIQPKWDEWPKQHLKMGRPSDYHGDGNIHNGYNDQNVRMFQPSGFREEHTQSPPSKNHQSTKKSRRNQNRIIKNNFEYVDNSKVVENIFQGMESDVSHKKSLESCIASIRDAPILPYPRSSDILGISIRKASRSSHKNTKRVDMSGLKSKDIPTMPKMEDSLPSLESLFGLDEHETLSEKLGPTYRKPNILTNPNFRIVHDKPSLKKDFNKITQDTLMKKYVK